MSGRFHRSIETQHKKYGSVVRISPNELSFASVGSWKGIYGHPTTGKPTFPKSEFYDMYGAGYDSGCIGSERDPKTHGRMKKSLSAAFSTKALAEQEYIIQRCVDDFIRAIGLKGTTKAMNMSEWFEMVSFDILGEMAFGESFHCVESGEPHFWTDLILKHLFFITLMDNLRHFAFISTLGRYLLPRWTVSIRNKHSGFSRDKVASRLESKTSRKDFMTNLAAKVADGEVSKEEMTAHASTLIIAGGETVSTFLAGASYYLLTNPETYLKLRREIRDRYKSYDEIDSNSSLQLPYLQAVVNEGLRMYPPGSQGFPRVSPGAVVDGMYVPAGAEVYTSAWTVTHDPQYFHEPFQFKPDRWTDPTCTDMKEASQPFSLGPRGCLGRNFALVEISLIMAKMHWKYDMELMDKNLDWEGQSHMHVMWWKPHLNIRFSEAH
ncbi:Cytochrome P450 monooxygenase orf9 [Lobaria immixta]|nr:Cytochrome P450 monooxygenase orf9 [Lobaria immixta]